MFSAAEVSRCSWKCWALVQGAAGDVQHDTYSWSLPTAPAGLEFNLWVGGSCVYFSVLKSCWYGLSFITRGLQQPKLADGDCSMLHGEVISSELPSPLSSLLINFFSLMFNPQWQIRNVYMPFPCISRTSVLCSQLRHPKLWISVKFYMYLSDKQTQRNSEQKWSLLRSQVFLWQGFPGILICLLNSA